MVPPLSPDSSEEERDSRENQTIYPVWLFPLIDFVHLFAITSLNPAVFGGFSPGAHLLLLNLSVVFEQIEYKEGMSWGTVIFAALYCCWLLFISPQSNRIRVHHVWTITLGTAATGISGFLLWMASQEVAIYDPDSHTAFVMYGVLLLFFPLYIIAGCTYLKKCHDYEHGFLSCEWKRFDARIGKPVKYTDKVGYDDYLKHKQEFSQYTTVVLHVMIYVIYPATVLTFGEVFKAGIRYNRVEKCVSAVSGILLNTLLTWWMITSLVSCKQQARHHSGDAHANLNAYASLFTMPRADDVGVMKCGSTLIGLLEKIVLISLVLAVLPITISEKGQLEQFPNATNYNMTHWEIEVNTTLSGGIPTLDLGVQVALFCALVILMVILPVAFLNRWPQEAMQAEYEHAGPSKSSCGAICACKNFTVCERCFEIPGRMYLSLYLGFANRLAESDGRLESIYVVLLCIFFAVLCMWWLYMRNLANNNVQHRARANAEAVDEFPL